jgi:hypothetical protein
MKKIDSKKRNLINRQKYANMKRKLLIFFGLFFSLSLHTQGQNLIDSLLTKKTMIEVISSELPERKGLSPEDQMMLFEQLEALNVRTTQEFKNILKTKRK